jgi:G6PDH family F420-dependent oxidoreductase
MDVRTAGNERAMSDFKVGYFLSSEELGPREQIQLAGKAEESGIDRVWISDHYHPWTDKQGQSPFVWSVIGGIAATTDVAITTAVTCPTFRIHPAIIAQAAATSALMTRGKFFLGLGTGEALNEHILGDRWPSPQERIERLEEAVALMRELWTGNFVSHRGKHFHVDRARIYSAPDEPVPVYVSGFGPEATKSAGKYADGYINTKPDADMLRQYREAGGKGPAQGGLKVCWGEDEDKAAQTAYELWGFEGIGGQTSQELPMPAHFESLQEAGSVEQTKESVPCGPDPAKYVQAITEYADAGYDEVYVSQMGPDQEGFLNFFRDQVMPKLGS